MANNAKRGDNKNKIIGICCGIVVVILLVVAIVAAVMANTGINDAYFVSDGSKYVLTIDNTEEEEEGEGSDTNIPLKTHYVYYYSGDDVTEVKLFSEFADADKAKSAYDELLASGEDIESSYKAIELNGKYVVLTFLESDYEGMTASDVKDQIELINGANNEEEVETTETTEGGEETTVEETETTVEE